jgi:hypothetical protein
MGLQANLAFLNTMPSWNTFSHQYRLLSTLGILNLMDFFHPMFIIDPLDVSKLIDDSRVWHLPN